jgi:hypothetical protein
MGFRFGTGIGAVLVFLSGGGNGIPGGGSGCPLPITKGRGDSSDIDLCSPCLWSAFQPHFFAVAAALVTAARERRFVSDVADFPDEDVEFSRLGS